ncbi:translation initiation factor IF-2 [Bacteroidetes/Chlorobi group bacterium ChocPot_Mid]|nr:MAG: translation initiation factor IF-2 [Bacteroidetes/Chlorobi group bacterium ChocPot_Mid]
MAEGNKKLIKVASEINIGKDAIVEFLHSKGYEIQAKPTAVLTPEMLEVVYDKFKRERRAAEIQRDKLEKHKKPLKTKEDEKKQIVEDKIIEKTETKKTEKEEEKSKKSLIEQEIVEKPKTKKKSEEEIEDKSKISEETLLVPEIDVDKKKQKKIPSEKVETVAEKTDKVIIELPKDEAKTKFKKAEDKEEINKLVGDSEKLAKKDKEDKEEKLKKPKENKIEQPEVAKHEVDILEQPSTIVTAPVEDESTLETDEDKKKKGKKRKKRKKVLEVEYEEGEVPQLRGLKIVGKIDIGKEKVKTKKERFEGKEEEDVEDEKLFFRGKKDKSKRKKDKDKKKKKRLGIREQIKDEDVDRAIRETISEMSESSAVSHRSKLRHRKKIEREEKEQRKLEEKELESKKLQLTEFVTTAALADLMNVSPNEIILKCMELGLMVTLNQRLDKDTITVIADDYEYEVEFLDDKTAQLLIEEGEEIDESKLEGRSPIVTVMGHVDHGKTSLLDYIRKSHVVAGEAGGITQHIGAYRVELADKKAITFLDTPGHEAFTAMRARGAQVTDIVVLVVAADDSVMPQTLEAISHAQAANVPIVVAINKIDKADANPERIKQQLSEQNILIEEWGGKYQCVEISAKKGINVDVLLEKILLEAEVLELKANPYRKARGTVIEANMDKGFGAVATVIVQQGTLKVGDPFVAGVYNGRVRAMFDERDKMVKEAGPSIPVRVIGFNGLPEAGDILIGVETDVEARSISNERQQLRREQEFRQMHLMTLDDISRQIQIGGVKDLFLIIKGDVSGSVEALSDSLQKQSTDEVRVIILHKGVGSITESDVMLAVASKAVIIGFQVSPTGNARKLAERESVDIRLYNIIYDAINEVRLALEGLLAPELREEITGVVEVRKVFRVSKLGFIAGCFVKEGKITRNSRVRVLRDGLTVYNGTIHSLKREKDDVREVESGYECGIMLDGFGDIEQGDIIQSYKLLEIKRTLT